MFQSLMTTISMEESKKRKQESCGGEREKREEGKYIFDFLGAEVLAAEDGRGSEVPAVARVARRHHVERVEHLLRQLEHPGKESR
jgi:hypothetical protein